MKKKLANILLIVTSIQSWSANAEGLSMLAELLVLQASQETASTWASVLKSSGRTLDFDATNIKFGWHTGFRGGLLYTLEHDCWDVGLYWTHVPAKASKNFSIGDQIVVPEFFSGFLSRNFFFGANLNWKLAMNMVDIEVGRTLNVSESLTIRPSIGVKGGTINQAINADWNAGFFTATESLKNNFSGVGPSVGINSKWNLINALSVFGDFSTAFLFGNWRVKDTYSRPSALNGLVTPTTITTSMNNPKLGTLMYKFRMGFEWVYESRFPLTLQLGYEMQFWPNQLRLTTFQQLPVHGGLTLQGGICQFRIDF